jgi:hypothetical protein
MKFEHKNITPIRDWLDRNSIEPTTDPSIIFNIYREVHYFGKIVNSSSFSDRIKFCKIQYDFIQKSMMNLLYENNGETAKGLRSGYVYAISNPAWSDYVKVGCAIDVYDRLSSYQTSSPFRDYELIGYVFAEDRLLLEKEIHQQFDRNGEWIKADKTTMKKFLAGKKVYPEEMINQFHLDEMLHNAGCSDIVISTKKFRHKCIEVIKQVLDALILSGKICDSRENISNHLIRENNIRVLSDNMAYNERYNIAFIRNGSFIHTIPNYY